MAFVFGGVCSAGVRRDSAVCSAVSRRQFVQGLAGVGAAALGTGAAFAVDKIDLSLEELKKDVEKLQYETEVLKNPDPAQKEKSDFAPKAKDMVGSYRETEKKLEAVEKQKYEDVVKAELNDAARLKALFSK